MYLDLGCGLKEYRQHIAAKEFNCDENLVINADVLDGDDIDICGDIYNTLQLFKDNQLDGILLSHLLEHFDPDEQIEILEHCHRVCKANSKVIIYCPHFSSAIAKTHLTHRKLIGYNTFDNFLKNSKERYSQFIFAIQKKIIFGRAFKWFTKIANAHAEFYEQYLSSLMPAREVKFEMTVIK